VADYSPIERLLHRLALGSPVLGEMLHDIERAAYLKKAPPFDAGRHVFVTGLARAGTTILMRELYGTGEFGSLTYADMPFVLAPNLWARMSRGRRRQIELKERAHGDGIKVNAESPEALDEVYWRLISGIDYILPHGVRPHNPDDAAIDGYRDYIRLILRRTGRTRYLSKNNNTLLRLAALADAWPSATFLVPLRRPLQHARSLAAQHERFLNAEPFTRKYMTWLGHHEFGATHRPFLLEGKPDGEPTTLGYWIQAWISAYSHVLNVAQERENIMIVPYEDLCRDPAIWSGILRRVGIEHRPMKEIHPIPEREAPAHDLAHAAVAEDLYAALRNRAVDRND